MRAGKKDLKRQGSLHDKENLESLIKSKLLLYSDNAQQGLEVMIKHLQNNVACHYEGISYRAVQCFECLRDLIQPCRASYVNHHYSPQADRHCLCGLINKLAMIVL